jgi:hypothetical protein
MGVNTIGQCLGVGFLWLVLMLAFEVGVGRLVFRASWERLASDSDFRRGGLLSIGMLARCAAPLLVVKLKGLPQTGF